MKKAIALLIIGLVVLLGYSTNAQAATTEIYPKEISSPGQTKDYRDADVGIIYTKAKGDGETIYSVGVKERGWLLLHKYGGANTINGNSTLKMFGNASLTRQISPIYYGSSTEKGTYRFFYLDEGTYYLQDTDGGNNIVAFGYFLPNSAVISHKLVKAKDNNSYTDTITFTPHLGTTQMLPLIVDPENVNNTGSSFWGSSNRSLITNANDEYTITNNGEYTVRAKFTDTEWQDFPVMYSYSVYDIGKKSDTGSSKDSTEEGSESKDTFVTDNIRYKVTGKNEVELIETTNKKIKSVTIGNTVSDGTNTYKVTAIAAKAFYKCTALKTLEIGSNVKTIGKNAFYGCKALKSIVIPENVKKIGAKAFYKCSKLSAVTINSTSITAIGSSAFGKITSSATISVPKSKLSNYKELLETSGIGKKVKIK